MAASFVSVVRAILRRRTFRYSVWPPAFFIRLMSRSIEPSVLASSISDLAMRSTFSSMVLFLLNAALANDLADDVLNAFPSFLLVQPQITRSQGRDKFYSLTRPSPCTWWCS